MKPGYFKINIMDSIDFVRSLISCNISALAKAGKFTFPRSSAAMDAFELLEWLIDALFYNSSKAMVSSQRKDLRRPKFWKTYVKEPCGSKFSNGICLGSSRELEK